MCKGSLRSGVIGQQFGFEDGESCRRPKNAAHPRADHPQARRRRLGQSDQRNHTPTRNGWDCSLSLIPFRRNSLAPRSASNDPKRKTPFSAGIYTVLSPLDLTAPFQHLTQAPNLLRTSEISVELYLNREPDLVHEIIRGVGARLWRHVPPLARSPVWSDKGKREKNANDQSSITCNGNPCTRPCYFNQRPCSNLFRADQLPY